MASSTLITVYIASGVIANRPTTPSVPAGGSSIYYATDTGATSIWNSVSSSWVGIAGGVTNAPLNINLNSGTPSALPTSTSISVQAADSTVARLGLDTYNAGSQFYARRSGGTGIAPSGVPTSVAIAQLAAFGYGTTGYSTTSRASIALSTTQNWTDTAQGTNIILSVTANNSVSQLAALTVNNDQSLTQGTSNTFLTAGGSLKVQVSVVASLPSATTEGLGAIRGVSNALSPVIGSPVVTGGAIQCLVMSNGTNWIVA